MAVDPTELVKLSTEIIDRSTKLGELKTQRDELNKQIAELDKELRPAILKQQQMMAALMGDPIPVPLAQVPVAAIPVVPGTPTPSGNGGTLRQKVVAYIQKCDESVSAMEIAEALHIDAAMVREVMLDLRRG
jgi:hypothetical protein